MSNKVKRSKKGSLGHRRSSLDFGVPISSDSWRLLKRLHDVGALVEFEVRVKRGAEPVMLRAAEFDLRGVSSAAFSTEREVLLQLAARVPGLRARRHSTADIRTLGELFPGALTLISVRPLPPPTPFAFTGVVPANQV